MVTWRFIPFKRYDPYLRIGLNQALTEYVQDGGLPTISLSGWDPSCINIGYAQQLSKVVNVVEAQKRNIPIVRRHGGGGACYLSKEGELCWSIVGRKELFPSLVPRELFKFATQKIITALHLLGIDSKYKPINDIVTHNGKISGSSLKQEGDVVYINGTLLYSVDKTILDALLQPENDSERESKPEHQKKVTSISNESTATFDDAVLALQTALLDGLAVERGNWTKKELERAKELSKTYASKEWLYHNEKHLW